LASPSDRLQAPNSVRDNVRLFGEALAIAASALALVFGAVPVRGSLPEYGAPANAGVIPLDAPQGVNFLVVADFNGDGSQDVLVIRSLAFSPRTFPVVLLASRGDGTFADQTSRTFSGDVPRTSQARRVIVADFNGDRRPDVFVADSGEDLPPFAGYQNTLILSAPGGKLVDASGNLPQRSDYSHAAAAADVNGDGAVDLFVGELGGGSSSVLINDGTGRFHDEPDGIPARFADPAQAVVTSAVFADVNRDGFPDLIIGGGSNGFVRTVPVVLLNDKHGAFPRIASELPLPPHGFDSPVDFKTADLNRDGVPDIVASYVKTPSSTGEWIQLLIGKGDGTFNDETQTRLAQQDSNGSWFKEIDLVDLNGDGAPEIATAVAPLIPTLDDPPPFYLNDGHGHFARLPQELGLSPGNTYSFIDSTGQGERDIVFSKDNASLELLRPQPVHGFRLYATLSAGGAVSLVDDQGARSIRAGVHLLVVWDQARHAAFRISGPGVAAHTGTAYTGITAVSIRLRAGVVYRYGSGKRLVALRVAP
jgi:FG-GAP-like repeat